MSLSNTIPVCKCSGLELVRAMEAISGMRISIDKNRVEMTNKKLFEILIFLAALMLLPMITQSWIKGEKTLEPEPQVISNRGGSSDLPQPLVNTERNIAPKLGDVRAKLVPHLSPPVAATGTHRAPRTRITSDLAKQLGLPLPYELIQSYEKLSEPRMRQELTKFYTVYLMRPGNEYLIPSLADRLGVNEQRSNASGERASFSQSRQHMQNTIRRIVQKLAAKITLKDIKNIRGES